MKKHICLALCTIALVGCSKADNAENTTQNTTVATASENADWVDNTVTFNSAESFFEEGAQNLYCLNTETNEHMPITPYAIGFDEDKYEFVQILSSNGNYYSYVLNDIERHKTVNVTFKYYDSYESVSDLQDSDKKHKEIINFNGNPDTEVLIDGSVQSHSAELIAGENCSVSVSRSLSNDDASQAINDGVSYKDLALDLLNDFTISKA